jgi:hypothetical protein
VKEISTPERPTPSRYIGSPNRPIKNRLIKKRALHKMFPNATEIADFKM